MKSAIYIDDGVGYPSNEAVLLTREIINGYTRRKSQSTTQGLFVGVHQLDASGGYSSQCFKLNFSYKYGSKRRLTNTQIREFADVVDNIGGKCFKRQTIEQLCDDDNKVISIAVFITYENNDRRTFLEGSEINPYKVFHEEQEATNE